MVKNRFLFLSLFFMIVLCLGVISFVIRYRTDGFQSKVKDLDKQIKVVDVEIRILKSEVALLTSISKMKTIADKYLPNYKNISRNDFISPLDIPINPLFE